jgi:hypothetical protein
MKCMQIGPSPLHAMVIMHFICGFCTYVTEGRSERGGRGISNIFVTGQAWSSVCITFTPHAILRAFIGNISVCASTELLCSKF